MPALLLLPPCLVVVLTPIALAWTSGLPPRPPLDEVSSAIALAACAALLVEFLLSGRFRWVSNRIGLDVRMRMDQLFGRTILALALLRPFLYTLPQAETFPPWDPTGARRILLDPWGLITGALARVGIGVLVLTGIARDRLPYRYEQWRLPHGLGAAAVAGFGGWRAVAVGRCSAQPVLLWLCMALRDSPFCVADNPFSIASAPSAGDAIAFVVKEAGDLTRAVRDVKPGQPAWIDGPHGALVAPEGAPGIGLIGFGLRGGADARCAARPARPRRPQARPPALRRAAPRGRDLPRRTRRARPRDGTGSGAGSTRGRSRSCSATTRRTRGRSCPAVRPA
ncbi:MAG: hypothetical protein EA355_01315 [Rhodobacteraceae bacterium]|nr:MAG: hypothetical protein EA355_01315 [Paracoccaceae bacterium]